AAPIQITYTQIPILLSSLNLTSNSADLLSSGCNQRSILDIIWSCVLVLAQAVRQLWAARLLFNKYKAPGREWTMKHAHFLRMGGFYAEEHGEVLYLQDIMLYLDSGKISFPNVTEADIQDKSKVDGLSKIILVTQTLWFIIQCIGRLTKGLALTPLEVTTLAVTTCTFMLSIFWWHKPFDVRQPIRLEIHSGRLPQWEETLAGHTADQVIEVSDISGPGKIDSDSSESHKQQIFRQFSRLIRGSGFSLLFEFEISTDPGQNYSLILVLLRIFGVPVAGAMIFGLVHCLSWNSHFPSLTERNLWRISAVIVSAFTLIGCAGFRFATMIDDTLYCASAVLYILSRSYLLVEAAIAFRTLPPSALENIDWLDFFPTPPFSIKYCHKL
ncbi:hypothetical protein BDQ17DRAFT_1354872, partial [Cyathus striatus]